MSTTTVTLFFALLALGANVAVLTGILLTVAARWSPAAAQLRDDVAVSLAGARGTGARWMAAGVALVASLGSLYLSEIANFIPCRLCWYQRAAMYPIVGMATAAAVVASPYARKVTVGVSAALAIIGLPISIYHVVLERFPILESGVCDPTIPCTLVWVRHFGFVTIPYMAGSAFALILLLLGGDRRARGTTTEDHDAFEGATA